MRRVTGRGHEVTHNWVNGSAELRCPDRTGNLTIHHNTMKPSDPSTAPMV
jgi:hypothetical protein